MSDFLIQIDVEDVSASGVDSIDGSFKIAPSGLDVGAKFKLDGVGKVKVSGEITNSKCALTAEKIKIFNLFTIKDARIEFCEMAKEGAYAFAGELKVLGIPAKVSGLADAADSAASVLSEDVKFSDDFEVKKKFGVGGSGIAGGYVKLTASGNVDVLLNAASGKLSSDDWPRLNRAATRLKDCPLFIDDTAGITPFEMRNRVKEFIRESFEKI